MLVDDRKEEAKGRVKLRDQQEQRLADAVFFHLSNVPELGDMREADPAFGDLCAACYIESKNLFRKYNGVV